MLLFPRANVDSYLGFIKSTWALKQLLVKIYCDNFVDLFLLGPTISANFGNTPNTYQTTLLSLFSELCNPIQDLLQAPTTDLKVA